MLDQSVLSGKVNYKSCKGCNTLKPYTKEYFEIGRNYCKDCRSQQDKERRESKKIKDIVFYKCRQMAYDAHSRIYAPSRDYKNCYRDLDEPYEFESPKEMCTFLYETFYDEIKSLLNKDSTPSVDRIDSTKGYSKDNIRIISHKINTKLGVENRKRKVKMVTPNNKIIIFDSTAECVEYFGYKRNSSGRVSQWIKRCQGGDGAYKVPDGYYFEYADK